MSQMNNTKKYTIESQSNDVKSQYTGRGGPLKIKKEEYYKCKHENEELQIKLSIINEE
jgi:hypothetical protein